MANPKLWLLMTLAPTWLLGGCASIEGSQRRVLGTPASMALVNEYPLGKALENFGQGSDRFRGGLSKQAYRDTVVMIYMNAIDARYHDFRTALGAEGRQAALGLDVAVLGLTGWASVAKASMVNELSAIAGGVAGTRAAIDKNLYFDKTLPALIAAMDTERLKTGAQILRNLNKNAAEYPLALAIADLNRYEMAGSLDLAIHQVTSDAAQEREVAQADYENAVRACDTTEANGLEVTSRRRRVTLVMLGFLNETPPDVANLKEMATLMGLGFPDNADAPALRTLIGRDLIANYCTPGKLDALIQAMGTKGWEVPQS
jgi:hypothetical protein